MTRTVTPVTRTSYTMMAKTIRALELHYPMIQFLIKAIIANTGIKFTFILDLMNLLF